MNEFYTSDTHQTITVKHQVAWGGYQLRLRGNRLRVRQKTLLVKPKGESHARGDVKEFTNESRLRMLEYLSSCVADYTHMITLTYPCAFPTDGAIVKEHLRRFAMKAIQGGVSETPSKDAQARSAFWFIEFQERGAPHFHIFVNFAPSVSRVSMGWYSIVGSDDERHLRAGTRCERLVADRAGTIGYAMKYAAKGKQKLVPEGYEKIGRFWGIYGCRVALSASIFVPLFDDAGNARMDYKKSSKFTDEVRNKMISWMRKGYIERVNGAEGSYTYKSTSAMGRAIVAGELHGLGLLEQDLELEYRALDFLGEIVRNGS